MPDDDRYLRFAEVRHRVPVAKSTLYGWIAEGTFPAPHKLGGNSVGWLHSEIMAWMKSRAVMNSEPSQTGADAR